MDTMTLQQTHWNQGDVPGAKISEYKREYPDWGTDCTREQEVTQAMMMGTHFSLSDGRTSIDPPSESYTAAEAPRAVSVKEQMVATHFDLTSPSAPGWETTHSASYRGNPAPPAAPPHMELQRGLGTKATFDSLSAFPPARPLYNDSYTGEKMPRTTVTGGRMPKATVAGSQITFLQGTTQKWQRTNFEPGDGLNRFTTTSGDALCPKQQSVDRSDPQFARKKRLAFARSVVMQGFDLPTTKTTTMDDATRPHPEHRPLPAGERTAFVSHQDHRNWNAPVTTTHHDEFFPKTAESVGPVNNRLQDSHGTFGNPAIREVTTLYEDSFGRPPQAVEPADMAAARSFHMGHHSTSASGMHDQLPPTEYRASYTGHGRAKASDICDALKGGHNVVAHDPRFVLRKSVMDTEYVAHPGVHKPPPVDNSLQNSHVQLKGAALPWTTTQQDYFQYETYHMPGRPF
jgi:hypothetical protein